MLDHDYLSSWVFARSNAVILERQWLYWKARGKFLKLTETESDWVRFCSSWSALPVCNKIMPDELLLRNKRSPSRFPFMVRCSC